MPPHELDAAASRLCLACGLCCNGVLFHIVRLQPTDSAKALMADGMTICRKKHEPYFKQPCAMLDDCACKIYAARPQRCRLFECQQIKRMAAGEIAESEARAMIQNVKHRVASIESLLARAGHHDTTLPLSDRCEQVIADHADDAACAEITDELRQLHAILNTEFRRSD